MIWTKNEDGSEEAVQEGRLLLLWPEDRGWGWAVAEGDPPRDVARGTAPRLTQARFTVLYAGRRKKAPSPAPALPPRPGKAPSPAPAALPRPGKARPAPPPPRPRPLPALPWRYSGDGVMSAETDTHVLEVYASGAEAPNGQPFFRWIVLEKERNKTIAHGLTAGEEPAMRLAIRATRTKEKR